MRDAIGLDEQVRAGFPFRALERFRRASGFSAGRIAEVVRIPPRTLARRRAGGKLRPEESERLLRVARVFEQTVELFDGDVNAARGWLMRARKALGGQTPLGLAQTEIGARAVEDLIGRLEHGVFT
ncbi:MAG TPA: antitoxin Xre/MbcA/ParS toxin-binding domain-containing protein [Phycisphaerae bacterium]